MDGNTKAAGNGLAQVLGKGDEAVELKWQNCLLKGACLNEVLKCVSSRGDCYPVKKAKPFARKDCRPIAEKSYMEYASFCSVQCEAQLLGQRGSTLDLKRKMATGKEKEEMETQASERKPPPTLTEESQIKQWKQCVNTCQMQKAWEHPSVKQCMETQLQYHVAECAKKNCLDSIKEKCAAKCQ